MAASDITIYGAYWCPDCRRSKIFLGDRQIPYTWVNIEEDKEGEAHVLQRNNGKRIIPTIEFADGSLLVEPSNAELARKLGLRSSVARKFWPLISLGAGPTGLTAALYATREAVDTLLIESGAVGGQATRTLKYDNIPGFPEGIDGIDFAQRLRKQAVHFGGEILEAAEVVRIRSENPFHIVVTAEGDEYRCHALLLAPGSSYRKLGVAGEDDYIGAGIHFCSTCDGPFYQDRHVAVIGGGNSAAEEALHLTRFASQVTVLVRGNAFTASPAITEKLLSAAKVRVLFNTEVEQFLGSGGHLRELQTKQRQTEDLSTLEVDGAFIFIGLVPNTQFLEHTQIVTDRWGFVATGHDLGHFEGGMNLYTDRAPYMLESSVPGIFAAGDVRAGSTKQVAAATGEGATSALSIREYLKSV